MTVYSLNHAPKRDNAALPKKLEIRRLLLGKMGLTEVTVLDACAGSGLVWSAMEDHVTIRQWIRCDIKPRDVNTLGLTATEAIRSLPTDAFNVIDIDPWGEPWEPYLALLPRITRPTAVFLTRGHIGPTRLSLAMLAAVGIPRDWEKDMIRVPELSAYVSQMILAQTWKYVTVTHAYETKLPHVSYYALGLKPSPIPLAPLSHPRGIDVTDPPVISTAINV